MTPYVATAYEYAKVVVYEKTPSKQQMAVFNKWVLEAKQNKSDT